MAKTFNDIKLHFFKKMVEFDPMVGFYWGLESCAALARPFDETLRTEQRFFFTRLLADLQNFPLHELSTQDRIDAEIMRTQALWQLLRLEDHQPLSWQNSTDISNLIQVIYYNLARQTGKPSEWDAILAKMNIVPEIIHQQKKNIELGVKNGAKFYKREVEREALELQNVLTKYFREDVAKEAKRAIPKPLYSKLEPKLKKAGNAIDKALKAYVAFVKSKVLKVAKDDHFAIGEDEYAWRLRNLLFSSETPASLFEYGKKQVEATQKEMQKLAGSTPLKAALEAIQKDAPKSDEAMFQMYRDNVDRVVTFIKRHQLFRLPNDYKIDLTETPEAYHNVLSVAAMNPVPPFSDSIPAQFWVTPTRTHKYPQGSIKLLQENHCRAAAPNLVVHEAVPGHDLQTGFSARRFIASGRKDPSFMVRSFTPDVMFSLGVEGWAHYTEQLMAEQGFYSNHERLFQLKDAQWRNVRIVVDVGIHTGRMTYKEAVTYMAEKTMAGEVTAEREIYRYSKYPLQAITYHLGKRDILELREKAQQKAGKGFDLAAFHELLLTYDGVPISLFRDDLLSRLS